MPDGPGTTDDIPLEQVHTYAQLRSVLNRLHERAGRPSAGAIRRSASLVPGLTSLSRNRIVRILRGPARPSRGDLRALLSAYGVPEDQRRRWEDAWARAAGERPAEPPPPAAPLPGTVQPPEAAGPAPVAAPAGGAAAAPGAVQPPGTAAPVAGQPRDAVGPGDPRTAATPGPVPPAGDVDLHAANARRLLEVRERCADRLRRLKNELAAAHAQADPDDPNASTQLVRSLDFALRRLQDIIDEACTEVLAVLPTPVPLARPGLTAPALPTERTSTVDNGAAGAGAGGPDPRGVAEPEDQALAWLSAVQEAVPLPVVAHLLKVMRDVPLFNHIAQERPLLMTELLAALPAPEAARWLQTWEPESAAEALAVAEPPRAAEHVALMPPDAGAALLARMSQRRAVAILTAMRREPAARRLIAMGSSTGATLLERMERSAATVRLLLIQQLDPELAAKFLSLMSDEAASECLYRMDQEAADQRQARDLLDKIRDQRPDPNG
jgi:flagellar motility protein MotE (MotC chaperone)